MKMNKSLKLLTVTRQLLAAYILMAFTPSLARAGEVANVVGVVVSIDKHEAAGEYDTETCYHLKPTSTLFVTDGGWERGKIQLWTSDDQKQMRADPLASCPVFVREKKGGLIAELSGKCGERYWGFDESTLEGKLISDLFGKYNGTSLALVTPVATGGEDFVQKSSSNGKIRVGRIRVHETFGIGIDFARVSLELRPAGPCSVPADSTIRHLQ